MAAEGAMIPSELTSRAMTASNQPSCGKSATTSTAPRATVQRLEALIARSPSRTQPTAAGASGRQTAPAAIGASPSQAHDRCVSFMAPARRPARPVKSSHALPEMMASLTWSRHTIGRARISPMEISNPARRSPAMAITIVSSGM